MMPPETTPRRRVTLPLAVAALLTVAVLWLIATGRALTALARGPVSVGLWLGLALPLLGLAGWLLVRLARQGRDVSPIGPLLGVATLTFGLYVSSCLAHPWGFAYPAALTLNPASNSYYQTAAESGGLWLMLRDYEKKMPAMVSHAQTAGAGPVLFYGVLRGCFRGRGLTEAVGETLLGLSPGVPLAQWTATFRRAWQYPITEEDVTAALLVALAVLALAAAGVVPAGLLGWELGGPRGAAAAAALWLLTPGLTIYTCCVDQVYASIAAVILLAWLRAARAAPEARGQGLAWAALASLMLTLGVIGSFGLLALGAPLLVLGLLHAPRPGGLRVLAPRLAVLVLGPLIGYAVLKVAAGYDLLAVTRVEDYLRMQVHIASWGRPYRVYLWLNLSEPALMSGPPLLVALIAAGLPPGGAAALRRGQAWPVGTAIAAALVLTLLAMDVSGRTRGETSRIYLFLTPVACAVAAAAAERPGARRWAVSLAVLGALWLVGLRAVLNVWAF
jgi:hypothetical protein